VASMNLVGKIFVVLILVASTVFMTMGLMVYASHQNWYEAVTDTMSKNGRSGWKEQLTNAKKEKADLLGEIDKYHARLDAEKASHLQQLAKAHTALIKAEAHKTELENSVATLQKSLDQSSKTLELAQNNLTGLRKENEGLRNDVRNANKAVDDQLKIATETEDKLHIALGQLADLKKRNEQLAGDYSKAFHWLKVLRPDLSIEDKINVEPPLLRGRILDIDKDDRAEVSLGSDDGLRQGHTLEIYRGDKYLGRMRIEEAKPHQAIGLILKEFKQETIRKGDQVATRLRAA
jgi:predicted nuclease with TOPRIM domain